MLRRRTRQNRAAIAEIVGTLVLLVATIAIGTTLFGIATGGISTGILNQSNNVSIASQRVQERISVFDVWFHEINGTKMAQIHLLNYGEVYVQIAAIYANMSGQSTPQNNFTLEYPNGVTVSPGYQAMISFNCSYVSGQNYEIRLVSEAGSTFTSIWGA